MLLARFHNLSVVQYLNLLKTFLVENLPCEGALVRSDELEPLLGKVNLLWGTPDAISARTAEEKVCVSLLVLLFIILQ